MKQIKYFKMMNFANSTDEVNNIKKTLVKGLTEVGAMGASRRFSATGLIDKMDTANYETQNELCRQAFFAFANKVDPSLSLKDGMSSTEVQMALDNTDVSKYLFSVISETLTNMIGRYTCPFIDALAETKVVDFGSVATFNYKQTTIPQLQRANRQINTAYLHESSQTYVTIKPELYTDGITVSATDILLGNNTFGDEIALVYAGIRYAQYNLLVGKLFGTETMNKIAATPFYNATYSRDTFLKLTSALSAFNDSPIDNVEAYGTPVALQVLAGSNMPTYAPTYADTLAYKGYVDQIAGVKVNRVEQFGRYAAPLAADYAGMGFKLPDDKVLVVSGNSKKMLGLATENYVRVGQVMANNNVINRNEWTISVAFNAEFIGATAFGIQVVAEA